MAAQWCNRSAGMLPRSPHISVTRREMCWGCIRSQARTSGQNAGAKPLTFVFRFKAGRARLHDGTGTPVLRFGLRFLFLRQRPDVVHQIPTLLSLDTRTFSRHVVMAVLDDVEQL